MDFFVPFLMLFVPGLIAICIHEKTLVRFTRENWQPLLWKYLFYSFAIVLAVYFVIYLDYPERVLSFSLSAEEAHSNIQMASFVLKYSLLAVAAALLLPKVWAGLYNRFKKGHILDKIPADE
jgi:hypothetical protein